MGEKREKRDVWLILCRIFVTATAAAGVLSFFTLIKTSTNDYDGTVFEIIKSAIGYYLVLPFTSLPTCSFLILVARIDPQLILTAFVLSDTFMISFINVVPIFWVVLCLLIYRQRVKFPLLVSLVFTAIDSAAAIGLLLHGGSDDPNAPAPIIWICLAVKLAGVVILAGGLKKHWKDASVPADDGIIKARPELFE